MIGEDADGPSADLPAYTAPTKIALPSAPLERRLRRQARTVEAFATSLGPLLVGKAVLRRRVPPAEVARRLRRAFDALGSTYVKFGQLIASSPGAFGAEVAAEFRTLLDEGPTVDFETVRATVETAFGRPIDELFASFEPQPLAAASMAVVHRATLPDGRTVAVKVLRPGMAARAALDLDIMQPLFKRLGLMGLELGGMLYRYLTGFRSQVAEELDLRNEARTMVHMRQLAAEAGLEGIVIPAPIEGLVATDVLAMEYLDGVPIDDFAEVGRLGIDAKPLVRELVDFWFLTGLRDGVFHGDIHAGNLMLLRDGRLGLLDWGIVGVLDERTRFVFRRFVQAMLGDAGAFADVAQFMQEMLPFVGSESGEMLEEANREIGKMLTRPFGEVDMADALRNGRPERSARLSPAERKEVAERLRRQRRFERQALKTGVADSHFGQANFLLFKQLLYFDRYGKMYMADEALLGNRQFLLGVLGDGEGAAAPAFPVAEGAAT
ncbi:MAG TPA: AarF/UbiB family protein [Acidimicrobiales bacterium]|nr:AarF/UbiB family protein [Acidimicrobiales bacterium]